MPEWNASRGARWDEITLLGVACIVLASLVLT